MSDLFPDVKTVVFFVVALAVALANLFGFADWQPGEQLVNLLLAIVSLVGALLGLLDLRKIRKLRAADCSYCDD